MQRGHGEAKQPARCRWEAGGNHFQTHLISQPPTNIIQLYSRSSGALAGTQWSHHSSVTHGCFISVHDLLDTVLCSQRPCSYLWSGTGLLRGCVPAFTPKVNFLVFAKSEMQNHLLCPIECRISLPCSINLWCGTHQPRYRTPSFLEISEKCC